MKKKVIFLIIILILLCIGIYFFIDKSRILYPKKGNILGYNYTVGESYDLQNNNNNKYYSSILGNAGYTIDKSAGKVKYIISSTTNLCGNDIPKIYIKRIKDVHSCITVIVTQPKREKRTVSSDWICYPTVSVEFDKEPKCIVIKNTDNTMFSHNKNK